MMASVMIRPAQAAREDKGKEAKKAVKPVVMREVVDRQENLRIQGIHWMHSF